MNFNEIGYRGHFSVSKAYTHLDPELDLFVYVESYNSPELAEEFCHQFLEDFKVTADDTEATSPFERLPHFDDHQNAIIKSCKLVHENYYHEYNEDSFREAFELSLIYKPQNKFYFFSVGGPDLSLISKSLTPRLIHTSHHFYPQTQNSPGLSPQLLGVEKKFNFNCTEIPLSLDLQDLLLINSNSIPQSFYQSQTTDLKQIAELFHRDKPGNGLWLGQLSSRGS